MPKLDTVVTIAVIATWMGSWWSPALAHKAPVAQTGQMTEYAEGDDGDIQAGVPWPSPRLIDLGNGAVRDRLTGLVWLKNADCFGERIWAQALIDANTLADGSCDLSDGSTPGDWRLPNVKELHSLIDFGRLNPALPSGHPFVNVQTRPYWSSTTSAGFPDFAWTIPMDRGGSNFDDIKDHAYYVWPVRGGLSLQHTRH
jgi:hypothetical protein